MMKHVHHTLWSSWLTYAFCWWFIGCGPSQKDIREQEESAEYHYNLAYGHYFDSTRPNVDAAMHEVLQSLKAKPDFAKAHMLAGIIYLGREQYFKAIRHFKRSIEIEPKYFAAMNNLGAAYLASGRWDDAIEVYKKLVSNIMYGTPGHGHNNLGWAYFKKGDTRKALQHFSMAVNLAPRLCPAYNNLGMVLISQRRYPRAKKYLMRAVKRCPNYAEPYFHLGKIAASGRAFDDAKTYFQTCIKHAGDTPLMERCKQRMLAISPTAVP
ncbi:MAG: tetratricopeptide repeat protein [Myxococcota bacterium]|nr:tetratricopeptide repeat protein [Myxococcota bacterium]